MGYTELLSIKLIVHSLPHKQMSFYHRNDVYHEQTGVGFQSITLHKCGVQPSHHFPFLHTPRPYNFWTISLRKGSIYLIKEKK